MMYEDEKGNASTLESGGMFELRAKANNQPVFIAKDKKIQTHLVSEIPGEFDFYFLNPQNNASEPGEFKWQKLTEQVNKSSEEDIRGVDSFVLKFDTLMYPELKPFAGLKWQLGQEDKDWNPAEDKNNWVLEKPWNYLEISKTQRGVKELKTIVDGQWYKFKYSPRGDRFAILVDKQLRMYNKSFESGSRFDGVKDFEFLTEELLMVEDLNNQSILMSKDLKIIKKIGEVSNYKYSKERKLIVCVVDSEKENISNLEIIDPSGKKLFSKEIEPLSYLAMVFYGLELSNDGQYILLQTAVKAEVLDFEGKTYKSFDQVDKYIGRSFRAGAFGNYYDEMHDCFFAKREDGGIDVWDWKKDKWYFSTDIDYREKEPLNKEYRYHPDIKVHPELPLLIVGEDKSDERKYWNWEKNTIKKINNNRVYSISEDAKWLEEYNYETGKGSVSEYGGKKILDYQLMKGGMEGGQHLSFTEDGEYFLLSNQMDVNKLYDKNAKLIKDFNQFDTNLSDISLMKKSNTVFTLSGNGICTKWNMKGKVLQQISTGNSDLYLSSLKFLDNSVYFSRGKKSKLLALNSRLLNDYNGAEDLYHYYLESTEEPDQILLERNTYIGNSRFERLCLADISTELADSNIYQLYIRNQDKEYRTYIYMDVNTRKAYETYKKNLRIRILKEENRSARERKFIRTMAISNFGIYNWDKYFLEENAIDLSAELDIELINEYSSVTLFHITGANRSAVIKYDFRSLDKFSFVPRFFNQLIAILPDNKIAVFDDSAFKKLDLGKIKNTKKQKFKMQILEGEEGLQSLEKIFDKPT